MANIAEPSCPTGKELSSSIAHFSLRGRHEVNQDSFFIDIATGVMAVADGVGSSRTPEKASKLAIEMASQVLSAATDKVAALARAIDSADREVSAQYGGASETTLDIVAICGDRCHAAHVGDGRVYRISGAGIKQLTADHKDSSGCIFRVLGGTICSRPDKIVEPLEPNDYVVLCSDGVFKELSDHELESMVLASNGNLESAMSEIKARLVNRTDDATMILYRHPEML